MAYTEDEWTSTMMALALLGDVYEDDPDVDEYGDRAYEDYPDPVTDEDTGDCNEMEHNQFGHSYGKYQS